MAYYEIGVHDDGEMIGIEYEDLVKTIMVLFYISSTIPAKLEATKVRFGTTPDGYNAQLKVTQDIPDSFDPELIQFMSSTNILSKATKSYQSLKLLGDEEESKLNGAVQLNPEANNGSQTQRLIHPVVGRLGPDSDDE